MSSSPIAGGDIGATPTSLERVTAFVEKMQTEAAQVIYRLRGAVAEFPNAGLKAKIGLRAFRVRRRYVTKRSRPNDAGAWNECLSLCTRLQERKRRCESSPGPSAR